MSASSDCSFSTLAFSARTAASFSRCRSSFCRCRPSWISATRFSTAASCAAFRVVICAWAAALACSAWASRDWMSASLAVAAVSAASFASARAAGTFCSAAAVASARACSRAAWYCSRCLASILRAMSWAMGWSHRGQRSPATCACGLERLAARRLEQAHATALLDCTPTDRATSRPESHWNIRAYYVLCMFLRKSPLGSPRIAGGTCGWRARV